GECDVTLLGHLLASADGQAGGRGQADDQGGQQCDDALASAHAAPARVVAGAQEVLFGLAERRGGGGGGPEPGRGGGGGGRGGRGAGGGGQQGAAVEVGRVVGVAGPLGGGGVQPGADDAVGVGVGQPGVAQQRPGGQQRLVADLHGAGGQGEQPFGGEGLQHC